MQKLIEPIEVGSKHFYLTIAERLYAKKGHVYKVICDCGKERTYSYYSLTRTDKPVKSCGCMSAKLSSKNRTLPNKQSTINYKYHSYKMGSKKRNLTFNLSLVIFTHLILSKCWYCGKLESFNGIDRVDNTKGYTEDNVVSCCKICNYMKRDTTAKDFLDTAKRITEYQKAREILGI